MFHRLLPALGSFTHKISNRTKIAWVYTVFLIIFCYLLRNVICNYSSVTKEDIYYLSAAVSALLFLTGITYRYGSALYRMRATSAVSILILSILYLPLACPLFVKNPFYMLPSLLYTWLTICLSYAVLRRFSCILWLSLYLLPIVQTAIRVRYGIKPGPFVIAEILGASPQDALSFINAANIVTAITCIALALFFFFACNKILQKEKSLHIIYSTIPILILVIITSYASGYILWPKLEGGRWRTPESTIMQIVHSVKIAQALNSEIVMLGRDLPSPKAYDSAILPDSRSICIVHVGESVRADHLSMNGYHRPTTPFLQKHDYVINFKDCTAVAPSTLPSTIAILTNAQTDVQEKDTTPSLRPTCGSIMDIFSGLNFRCYAFFSGDGGNNKNETWGAKYEKLQTSLFARSAEDFFALKTADSFPQIGQINEVIKKHSSENIFMLLNNFGSHMPFSNYNVQHPPFTPTSCDAYHNRPSTNTRNAERAVNAYDNTICYLDDYIKDVLTSLKGRPYVYVYISDHGEFLGDKGNWVRSGNKHDFFSTPVCQVPFFIIYSPEWEKLHPSRAQAIRKLRLHQNLQTGQGHVFHTLLGLFGIQSPYYDETLDLTSDNVKPYAGPHPSRNGKSADDRKWY